MHALRHILLHETSTGYRIWVWSKVSWGHWSTTFAHVSCSPGLAKSNIKLYTNATSQSSQEGQSHPALPVAIVAMAIALTKIWQDMTGNCHITYHPVKNWSGNVFRRWASSRSFQSYTSQDDTHWSSVSHYICLSFYYPCRISTVTLCAGATSLQFRWNPGFVTSQQGGPSGQHKCGSWH